MCKICSVPGCDGKVVAKGYCNKHYKENKRNGHIKDVVDASDEMAILAQSVLPTSGAYTDATMKELSAKKFSTKILKKIDGSEMVIKGDPTSFINAKTEEYTMFNGDAGMIKKVQGFRIYDAIKEKHHQSAAYILSEAINKNNEIVCLDGIDVGEDISDMPPASELQIAKMLGYKDCSRKFKDCMKSLIESNIIFKLESKDKKIIDVFYFNPVFQNSGKAVSPRLFFFFYYSFAEMAKQSKDFRFRFEQIATYSFAWIAAKRSDYKEVIANRKQLGELETARRIVAINAKIAKSYNIKVEFEANIDPKEVDQMDLFEARLSGDLEYSNISYEGVTKVIEEEEAKKYAIIKQKEDFLRERYANITTKDAVIMNLLQERGYGDIVDRVFDELIAKNTTKEVSMTLDTSRRTLTLTEVMDKVKKTSTSSNIKTIPPRSTKLVNSSLIQLIEDTDIEMPLDDSYMDMY